MASIAVDQTAAASGRNDGPVPMSFPAILRAPGLSDRFAHLRTAEDVPAAAPAVLKKSRRDEKEGKRWVRRKENARFVGNPHIVLPSKRDYTVLPPTKLSTFPQPLPHYLARNSAVPPATPAAREPNSANAGRFSLSLKGMRRELRKSGPGTELLVKDVEGVIVSWLRDGGVLLSPDAATELSLPGVAVGSTGSIREVSRTPLQLVWCVEDSAFTRYVVHCCARYHDVVSYSKDTSGQRLTYLLRPNVTRPNFHASAALDTPPVTDLESSVHDFDTESERDFRSDAGVDSDIERAGPHPLAAIVETSAPSSPSVGSTSVVGISDDEWSILGDVDADAEDSDVEHRLVSGVGSLALRDPQQTPRAEPRMRQASLRSHVWERQRRSASSPSRSPARRLPPRMYRAEPRAELGPTERSFYNYLFK